MEYDFHQLLYENQIQGAAAISLEQTIVVTFDGIKGSGKTSLAKKVAEYFLRYDPFVFSKNCSPITGRWR